ncbi:MAG: Inner membrane protein YohD [Pseudomonas citronellolis]|nr:MAG: Inner membrane protein YohD [Pseudomonas citronellolis]
MHFDLPNFLANYGYLAVFLGCLAEGETILILAGMVVHQHLLAFVPVVAVAAASGWVGDQALFRLGRHAGEPVLQRLHGRAKVIERVARLIRRYPHLSIFAVRFLYGMRLVGPVMIGASRISPWRFALVNLCGAVVWALLFVSAGYWAGGLLERFFGNLRPYRLPILCVVVLFFLALGAWLRWRDRTH